MKISDNVKIGLITTVIFILIMITSAIKIWPDIQKRGIYAFSEEPLKKVQLGLKAGETYTYRYSVQNQSTEVNYFIVQGNGCLIVYLNEVKNGQISCIKKDGTDSGGSNLTLSTPTIMFFKPWMLGVDKNWEWEVAVGSNLAAPNLATAFEFKETGETTYLGREAWIVQGWENGSDSKLTMLIDMEKRVLLRESGQGYVLELTKAPFPLSQQVE